MHAATQAGSTSYGYDANGSMTSRAGGTLTYDAENRLREVVADGVATNYASNGDGRRVKRAVTTGGATTTTYYVGNYYEVEMPSGTTTKYYYFGTQRVEMKRGETVTYLYSDHLGSTALTRDSSRGALARQWYSPYGTVRLTEGTLPTDYAFTGQKSDGNGLLFYQARYFDAALGSFVQADSIVPAPFQPQSLNRYSYGLDNPVKYTDPTRHAADSGGGECPDCWEELFEPYAKVAHAAEPQAFRGTQKEYRGAVAVYYYNLWQYGPDSPATQASYDMLDIYQTRLTNNGPYGTRAAVESAYQSAGGESTVSFGLAGGFIDLGRNALGLGPVIAGQGGRYGDLKTGNTVGDELTPHHMPQRALRWTNESDGGALVLPQYEHELTRTYGLAGRRTAIEDTGKSFRDVLATDIRDVRSFSGAKYNSGLLGVIQYYCVNFPELMKK